MTQTQRGRKPAAPTHAGTWNTENRNYLGTPFMIYCEHGAQGYSKRVRQFVTYKDCETCENYKQGQRKEVTL